MAGTGSTRDRRRRALSRAPIAVLCALVAASALGTVAVACLPDLATIEAKPDPLESSTPPFVGCGDGIIASLDDGGDSGERCDPGATDADVPGCSRCQITCEDGGIVDPTSGHCYFAVGLQSGYGEAITACKSVGAHVVTLGGAGHWVGLSRLPSLGSAYGPSRAEEPGFPYPLSPRGSSAGPCQGCFGVGADGGFFPFEDAAASDVQCVAAHDGTWFQVGCDTSVNRTVICEREPAGTRATYCSGPFCFTLASTGATKRYVFFAGRADRGAAERSCASLEGSLVVLESAAEREQLAHEIIALDPTAVEQQLWLGLAQDGGGGWTWEDGVAATAEGTRPLPWGNVQPGAAPGPGARAFMRIQANAYDTQLAYADGDPRATRFYVCQRPLQ